MTVRTTDATLQTVLAQLIAWSLNIYDSEVAFVEEIQNQQSETPSANSTRSQHISPSSSGPLSELRKSKSSYFEEFARHELPARSPYHPGNTVDPTGFEPAP